MPKHYVTQPHEKINIKLSENGFGARKPVTVIEVFRETVKKHGSRPALCYKKPIGGVLPNDFTSLTWDEYYKNCCMFAKSLIHFKVDTFKIVNILGFNSVEWFIANNGAILGGCIAAGIYTTNISEACLYISEHSKAEIVVVEGNKQLAKYADIGRRLSYLKVIVMWGEPIDEKIASKCSVPVYDWDSFLKCGESISTNELEPRMRIIEPGHCSTLIYTSGTTGPPKAVMISHDNVTWTTANICEGLPPSLSLSLSLSDALS